MKKVFYAFWRYDLFPYLLCGIIDYKVEPHLYRGQIAYYVPSYQGHFVPKFILDKQDGEALKKALSELRKEKEDEDKRIYESFVSKLDGILKMYGGSR